MANVDVTVSAKVATLALNKSVDEIQRKIDRAGRDAGDGFGDNFATGVERATGRANRAIAGTTKETERLRTATERYQKALASGDIEKIIAAQNRLGRVYRDSATQAERFAKSQQNLQAAMSGGGVERQVSSLNNRIQDLGHSFQGLSRAATPAMLAALVPALGALAGAAAQATGVIGLMPGVLGTLGVGFGTAKLGLMGFTDALENIGDTEKFAEALGKLSPNAQQAALGIQALMPSLKNLRAATQDALFADMAPQINALVNATLPTIERLTTGVATGLNGMLSGVMQQISSPEGMAMMETTVSSVVQAFQNLAPAAQPFTQAIMQLVDVGASFMPDIASAVSQGAAAFAEFIDEASRSGQLQEWIRQGIDAMKELGPITLDVAKTFLALAPIGERVLPIIADTLSLIADIMPPIAEVTARMSPLFATWEKSVALVGGAFDIVKAAAEAVIPVVNAVAGAIDAMLGPVREAINLANNVPGVNLPNIPNIPRITPGAQPEPSGHDRRARRGAPPVAGVPGVPENGYMPPGHWWRGVELSHVPSLQGWNPFEAHRQRLAEANRGGRAEPPGPVAEYTGDPMELLQGFPVTGQLYSAAQSVLEARHRKAQEEAELNALLQSNTAEASEIQRARNELAKAEQDAYEADLRLAEAKQSANDKQLRAMEDTTSAIEGFSVDLAKDMGISDGLGGILSNIVKFISGLAAAPLMGKLSAVASQKDPAYGSGLIGMAAAPFVTPSQSYGDAQRYTNPSYSPYSGYPGDAALLANVPAGQYSQTQAADLTQGIADCSSAVEDLVNILDGRPTGGRSMSTHNAAEWLTSRGFLPGQGGPGDFRVGFNSSHMQATLPGGTPFNWGSPEAAARGGVGGSGAFDPSFTDHYYRPTSAPGYSPSTTPAAPVADLYSPANTNPALTNPSLSTGPAGPLPTSAPGGGSPLPGTGFPQARPLNYGTPQPYGTAREWQPDSSGGVGMGGLLQGVISAGLGAAGAAGAGVGGQGAAMAAQLAMESLNRTIQYGSEIAGILGEGVIESLSVGGETLASGWIGRAASALAGTGASVGNIAGSTAAEAIKPKPKDPNDPNAQQHGQQQGANPGPALYVENFVQSPDRNGMQTAKDLAFSSYSSGQR